MFFDEHPGAPVDLRRLAHHSDREAHAARKDLAFRDLAEDEHGGNLPWEYSLLEPGARSPHGEGWSVYRFGNMRSLPSEALDAAPQAPETFERRSLFDVIAGVVRGRGPQRR